MNSTSKLITNFLSLHHTKTKRFPEQRRSRWTYPQIRSGFYIHTDNRRKRFSHLSTNPGKKTMNDEQPCPSFIVHQYYLSDRQVTHRYFLLNGLRPLSFILHRSSFILYPFFSIRILASTATTLSLLPNNGFRSISKISGAMLTSTDTLATVSANFCSLTGSCPRTP